MTYNVTEDIFFNNFIDSKKKMSKTSIRNYKKTLNKFCNANNTTLNEIINNCKNQQDRIIEKIISHGTDEDGNQIIEKKVIKFNVNDLDSNVKKYIDDHIKFCKSKNNKNVTINSDIVLIKSFLRHYKIELPDIDTLEDDSSKWYLLSKEDFKFVMADSTLVHASLIKFLQSTGFRLSDALSLTIGDYMEATSQYHNFVDVNEFIDNAPQDMIGSWYFHPHKTRRYNIRCQTFNDPETNNIILQNLRKIKNEYIPRRNKLTGLDLKLSKDDALFGSRKAYYKGKVSLNSVINAFIRKNRKLKEHHISLIKEKVKKGEMSVEDMEKAIEKIPRFHAHACRKYFETVIARNCGNLRICTLMEGHVSPVKTDNSYIKQDIEDVKEYYLAAIPDLSLENTEVKIYTSEIREEMENKMDNLQKENEEYKKKVDFLVEEISDIKKLYH